MKLNGMEFGEVLPNGDLDVASEQAELYAELVRLGVSRRKAEVLVAKYPVERIRRQLAWLPYRAARQRAPMLIASIERDYDEPAYFSEKK